MGKDPAFLFYSKDWLEGTAEMMPEEKGVYIDLLAHQHQKKSLPCETARLAKLVGLSEPKFLKLWSGVKSKFKLTDKNSNRLFNQKLADVIEEREQNSKRNKIIGTFASVIRLCKSEYSVKQQLKKIFKWEDFIDTPPDQLTNSLTIWLNNGLKSIVIGNGDGNENVIENENKGGTGGNLTREDQIAIYQLYTTAILQKEDQHFEQLAMKERVTITEEAVKDHLALLCRYPNMQPNTVTEFRQSLIKHCKDFKIKTDGTTPKDEFLGTFNLTKARKNMADAARLDELERAKNAESPN